MLYNIHDTDASVAQLLSFTEYDVFKILTTRMCAEVITNVS
jgi:hypothetical protein